MDENNNGIINDSEITSSDFDYDVYSGGSAMEYLKQENERKKREREDAGKTAGMRKREEYERRFAGMSADELFDDRPKKKKPEDDFSDFFDADEIERQQKKVKEFEEQVHPAPKVESMMPGEDTPSSQASGMTREEAMEKAAVMMAHGAFQREREERRFHNMRRSRYGRSVFYGYIFESILDSLNVSDKSREIIGRVIMYIFFFFVGVSLFAVYSFAVHHKLTSFAVLWGAVGGAVGGFLTRFIGERDTFLKALVNSVIELILLALAAVVVVFVKVK